MAVRYAVATGNWSSTSTWNGGTLPTSADDVYANGFTVTIDQNVNVLSIRNTAQSPAVAGGGFSVSTAQTITCTGIGIVGGNSTVITNTSTSTVNINSTTIFGTNPYTINHNATGTLNITSNLTANAGGSTGGCLVVNNTGTVNIIGLITCTATAYCIKINVANTLNITGDVKIESTGNNSISIYTTANNSIINITGNIYGQNSTGGNATTIYLNASNCILNITGIINPVTGSSAVSNSVIVSTLSNYIKIIGAMYAPLFSAQPPPLVNSNASSINLFSGPFICSETGMIPFNVVRMHYIKTLGSYFEFRDSSTNGALPPASPAPATRLVSPDTVVDAPIPANVRNGVTYALGSQTGTLKVPLPSQVSKGIQTDNTVGTAALTPEDVWNALTSTMTISGSIGERLKNASTVDTTGDQIASFNS